MSRARPGHAMHGGRQFRAMVLMVMVMLLGAAANAYAAQALPPTITAVIPRHQQIRVTFEIPANSCGAFYTFYIVGRDRKVYGPTNHNASFSVRGLRDGVPVSIYGIGHAYRMNDPDCRPSERGNVVTATPRRTPISPPNILSVVQTSPTSVELTADAPTGWQGQCAAPRVKYYLEYGGDSASGPVVVADVVVSERHRVNVDDLPPGVALSFYGVAFSRFGAQGCVSESARSNVVTLTLVPPFCPVTPAAPCRVGALNAGGVGALNASGVATRDGLQDEVCQDCKKSCSAARDRADQHIDKAPWYASAGGIAGIFSVSFIVKKLGDDGITTTEELIEKCFEEPLKSQLSPEQFEGGGRLFGADDVVTLDVASSDPNLLRVVDTAEGVNLERPLAAGGPVELLLTASVNGKAVSVLSWFIELEPSPAVFPGGPIQAASLAAIRTAIAAAWNRCGLAGPITWTDPAIEPGRTPVKAIHVIEAREAVNSAYRACGAAVPVWTDTINRGTPIKAIHFREVMLAALVLDAGGL